jgi:membrane protein implicated in regulation of membrane protease activity
MMKNTIVTLLICLIIYEIFEHLIFPLFWMIRNFRRKPAYGPYGMIGKRCVVKKCDGESGKVCIGSEIWNASSKTQLMPGAKAIIKDIKGLTLQILPLEILINSPNNQSNEIDTDRNHD